MIQGETMILTPQIKSTIKTVVDATIIKGSSAGLVVQLHDLLSKDDVIYPKNIKDFVIAILNNVEIKGAYAAAILEAQVAFIKQDLEKEKDE